MNGKKSGAFLPKWREAGHIMQKELTEQRNVTEPMEYGTRLRGGKASRGTEIAFFSLSATLLVGVFVCVLCDFIISGGLHWSLYVVGSAALAWLVAAPLLKFGRYRGIFAMIALSAAILPYLLLVERLCPAKGWVIPFALPIAILSLGGLWTYVLLLTYAKLRWTSLAAWALILFGVVENLAIQKFIENYLKLSPGENGPSTWIVALSCGFVAAVLFLFGRFAKRRLA